MQKISIPVKSFRKMENPNGSKVTSYEFYVNVMDVPDNIPLEFTNPRMQHMGSKPQVEIETSLLNPHNEIFHILNKGLAISAESVIFDNKTNIAEITLTDDEIHGDLDGGHTYRTIIENRTTPNVDYLANKYVKFEILIGLDEETLPLVAKARNTAIPVADTTIAELMNKFDIIKSCLNKSPFFSRIVFKQFEEKNDDEKDLLVRNVLAVMNLFNIKKFGAENHPTVSYTSNRTTVDYYLKEYEQCWGNDNAYRKMSEIAKDFFELHSEIETGFIDAYKAVGGKYGALNFAKITSGKNQRVKYSFEEKYLEYKVPEGLVLPILASFRALITEKEVDIDGTRVIKYVWEYNPFSYLKVLLTSMVKLTYEKLKVNGFNPQTLGKDSSHWFTLYGIVERQRIMDELEELRKLRTLGK